MQTPRLLFVSEVYSRRIRFHPASTICAANRITATIRHYAVSEGYSKDEEVNASSHDDLDRDKNTTGQDKNLKTTASPVSTKTNNTNEAKKKYYTLKNYREGPNTESGEVDSSQNQSVIKKHNKDVETRRQTY